jgi:hypothetical protein
MSLVLELAALARLRRRPMCAGVDPGCKVVNDRAGQLFVGRHVCRSIVGMAQGANQQAAGRVTGPNRAAIFAAGHERRAGIDPQLCRDFLASVTLQAFADEHWPDPRLEQLFLAIVSPTRCGKCSANHRGG